MLSLLTCPRTSVELDPHADDSGVAAVWKNPDAARDDGWVESAHDRPVVVVVSFDHLCDKKKR